MYLKPGKKRKGKGVERHTNQKSITMDFPNTVGN